MYFSRTLDLQALLEKKSHFLFGPRATGKSALIRHSLAGKAYILDLLDSDNYMRLSRRPKALDGMIATQNQRIVVIDEVQRVPEILNEVHRLIESQRRTFLLTGSSARKLKDQSINLLAGRARQAELFPLTSHELPDFDLHRYLLYGGLPMVVLSAEPQEELKAYVDTYLKEEIQSQALVKHLPAFGHFLQLSALTSGATLNYAAIANDAGVSPTTLREYYQILEDTFLGFQVQPWQHGAKRKAVSTARFYYFDIGVRNRLAGLRSLEPQTDQFGQAFEHLIAMELRSYLSYTRQDLPLTFWRTQAGDEVDFLLGCEVAIEVKSTEKVSRKHLRGLRKLMEEAHFKRCYLISRDPIHMIESGIEVIPWDIFLQKLWRGEILGS